jgi:hypothetical protein
VFCHVLTASVLPRADSQCSATYSAYEYFLFAEKPWADQGERDRERERHTQTNVMKIMDQSEPNKWITCKNM